LPPPLALALCSIFVVFLLRLERKQAPDVTRALWIPTIWMLYIGSKPLGAWLQQPSESLEAGSPLDRLFLIILMSAALIVLFKRGFDWAGTIRENAWLVLLIMFMLISVVWSDIPGISFKRWIKEFQAVLIAFVVLSEPSARRAMESILRRTTYVLIPFSLLLIKYFPIYGVEYGRWSGSRYWIGVTLQKNGLARLCIISAVFLIWSLLRRWKGDSVSVWKYQTHTEIFLLLLTLYLLGGPQQSLFYSATATYAFAMSIIVCSWVYFMMKSGRKVGASSLTAIISVIILFGIVTVFIGGTSIEFFASSAGRDATLTGRTEVWASLLPVVMENPLVGKGFGGFWTPRTRDLFQISEAHSGYLEILLGLGIIGILLVSMVLLSSCRKAHQELSHDFYWGLLWISYIIVSVVHNIGESSINSFTSQLTAVILFLLVSSTQLFRGSNDSHRP